MPSTYITGEFIRSLMPAFACCESYTERLLFWEQHGLTETLSYAVDKDNRLINKREDIKALCSVLSLAPYTIEEAIEKGKNLLAESNG